MFIERSKYGHLGENYYFLSTSDWIEDIEYTEWNKNHVRGHTNLTAFKVFIEDEKCVCLNYLDADIRIWLPKWAIGKVGAPKTR